MNQVIQSIKLKNKDGAEIEFTLDELRILRNELNGLLDNALRYFYPYNPTPYWYPVWTTTDTKPLEYKITCTNSTADLSQVANTQEGQDCITNTVRQDALQDN